MSLAFANLMLRLTHLDSEPTTPTEDIGEEIVQEARLVLTRRQFIHVKRLTRSRRSLAYDGRIPETVVEDSITQTKVEEAILIMAPIVK